jgi:hypothetical protein
VTGWTLRRFLLWVAFAGAALAASPLLREQANAVRTGFFRSAPLAKSALSFSPADVDFGTVRAGTRIDREFAFSNPTRGPIRIVDTSGTCGCVRAEPSIRYVEPGGSGVVRVTVDTSGRYGRQNFRVRVRTDEGERTGAELAIKGEIRTSLRPQPPRVFLGVVEPGTEHTFEIKVEKLEPVGEIKVTCESRQGGSPKGVLVARKTAEDEKGLTVEATATIPWVKGSQIHGVVFDAKGGKTQVPVVWTVVEPFQLSRPTIDIREGKGELVVTPRWPSVRLASIDTTGYALEATREELPEGGTRVLIRLTGSALDVPSGASVRLMPEPASLGYTAVPVYVRP